MQFYEVSYETPGVNDVRAGKKWHQLPNPWGDGREGPELWKLLMTLLQVVSLKVG